MNAALKELTDMARDEGIALGLDRGRTEGIALGRNEGIALGLDRGRDEGIALGRKSLILYMLSSGKSEKEVSELTGIDIEEIKKISEEQNQ